MLNIGCDAIASRPLGLRGGFGGDLNGAFDHQKERTDTQKVKDGCPKSNLSRRSQTMSRKSYSLFVVVIVVVALVLSQLACSSSGGGGDTSMPSGSFTGTVKATSTRHYSLTVTQDKGTT